MPPNANPPARLQGIDSDLLERVTGGLKLPFSGLFQKAPEAANYIRAELDEAIRKIDVGDNPFWIGNGPFAAAESRAKQAFKRWDKKYRPT